MHYFSIVFLATILSCAPQLSRASVVEFQAKSKDGLAQIYGEIDVPDCELKSYPVAMIVGGTGLLSRNGFFGKSHTDRDLLFKDLAGRLAKTCVATVRFDYRGVKCDLTSKDEITRCVDQDLRAGVTDETMLDDIQTVYDVASSSPLLDPSRIALIGHSEGSLNISRLIARKSIRPRALLFFGGVTESAKTILHWQVAERPVEWMFEMDSDHDQVLTNDEIKSGYAKSHFNGVVPMEALLNPDGVWKRSELAQRYEQVYQQLSDTSLAKSDTEPYVLNGVVFSSYKWWKRWFTDDVMVLDNLKEFSGPIEYHNGTIDSQTPGLRELEYLTTYSGDMVSRPTFVLHPDKGHGLSSDPLYGPIDEDIADSMVNWLTVPGTVRGLGFGGG